MQRLEPLPPISSVAGTGRPMPTDNPKPGTSEGGRPMTAGAASMPGQVLMEDESAELVDGSNGMYNGNQGEEDDGEAEEKEEMEEDEEESGSRRRRRRRRWRFKRPICCFCCCRKKN